MHRTLRARILSTAVMALILLFSLRITYAQTNLLTNPGFEPPFATTPGAPPMQVATGWTPWFLGALPGMSLSENVQPEYYPSSDVTNGLGVPRIRSGADAQQFSAFFATYTGGVYQQVSGVTAGTTYTFSVYAWLWSDTEGNPNASVGDGGMTVQVGIDPAGGTPPNGDANALQTYLNGLTWSSPVANQYDAFDQYTVTAAAQASTVTVYVRSIVSFPVRNNVTYLDDAALTAAGGSTPPTSTRIPATNTPVPPTAIPPTNTPVPVTNTPVPPTATMAVLPSNTPQPTSSNPSPTPPPTSTGAPATSTPIPGSPTPYPTVNRTQLPATVEHVVSAGQSVFVIANLYNSTVDAIIALNNLPPTGLIFPGQRLLIPVALLPAFTTTPVPGVMTATPPPTLTVLPSATPVLPPPTVAPTVTAYVVRPGDTLGSIAGRFGVTVRSLIEANGITNPNLIFFGQRLLIPTGPLPTSLPPLPTAIVLPTLVPGARPTPFPTVPAIQTYRLQQGDSLYLVALRFGVPLQQLIQLNGITNPNRVFPGQIVVIPPG